jgi:hypothetical protein
MATQTNEQVVAAAGRGPARPDLSGLKGLKEVGVAARPAAKAGASQPPIRFLSPGLKSRWQRRYSVSPSI